MSGHSREEAEEAAVTVAEFIVRLNHRPTATPDVREAAALERVVSVVYETHRRIGELEEALQPFADEASAYDDAKPYPDEDAHLGGFSDYTFGDLLRARAVLEGAA